MDEAHFDQISRAIGLRQSRRRVLALAAAVASGIAVQSDDSLGRARSAKPQKKPKGQELCNGTWVPRCPPHSARLSDCSCICDSNYNPGKHCNLCLPLGTKCCPDEKQCGEDCVPKGTCCRNENTCTRVVKKHGKKRTKTFCYPEDECCPDDVECPSAAGGCCNPLAGEECASFDGCCNTFAGKSICDGKWCCDAGQDCCPGRGCVDQGEGCCATPCLYGPGGCCGADEVCTADGCCPRLTHTSCGNGLACCAANTICTVGSYGDFPRASCCNLEIEGVIGCDGVCCAPSGNHETQVTCCAPGKANPCLC